MPVRALRVTLVCALLLAVVGSSPHIANAASQNPAKAQLYAVSCVAGNDCEAVGVFVNSANFYVPLAEVWNGKTWSPQPTPVPSGPGGLISLRGVSCLSASFCEAVGSAQHQVSGTFTSSPLVEVWNGTGWAIQPAPNAAGSSLGYLNSVSCVSASFCDAVGTYTNTAGFALPLAEAWDGTSWTLQSAPPANGFGYSSLNSVSCVSATFCEAVGQASFPGFSAVAEVWDGTSWTQQAIPNPADATNYIQAKGVSCISAGACEAVGLYNNGHVVTMAEVWNGTSWAVQPSPNAPGVPNSELFGVSCVSAAACEAVGDGTGVAIAEAWDGTSWTVQPAPGPTATKSSQLNWVSCLNAADCEAAGYGSHNTGRYVSLFEGWNGTVWTPQ